MKLILITLMLFFVRLDAESITDQAGIDLKIEETLFPPNGGHGSDISWINDENRALVIKNLQKRAGNQYEGPYVKTALVRAGHWGTILGLIEDLKDPQKDTGPLIYADQEIIPHVMPLVYSGSTEDPNTYGTGQDVMFSPVRRTAIGYVLGKIGKCEAFPVKTRKWAKDLVFHGIKYKDEEWVALVTSWWEHNQTAVLEKRYADAKWLPRYNGEPIVRAPEETRLRGDYVAREQAKRAAKRSGAAESVSEASSAGASPALGFWISIVVFAILLSGAFIRWKFTGRAS